MPFRLSPFPRTLRRPERGGAVVSPLLGTRPSCRCRDPARSASNARGEEGMLNWIRGLSDAKQGLLVIGALTLILVGLVLLINLIT